MEVEPRDDVETPRRRTRPWHRGLRKHRLAYLILGIYLLVFFFPTLFMGRVVSPNDVYRHYDPWSAGADFVAQNPVMHDPPLAYMPIAAMMQRAPESFHWNPWLASGIPGWGSAASALLTPFVLFPSLLPLPLFYTAIILLKLLFTFWAGYQWLREERLGKQAAALGSLVGAACGSMFSLWMWQSTNATVLYPAVLWAIARMAHGKKNSLFLLSLVGIAFLLSGYPASVIYGVWLACFYAVVQFIRCRCFPVREIGRGAGAVVIALLVCAPVLDPFVSFLGRSGYLEWRSEMSRMALPPEMLAGLLDPDHLGSVTEGWWRGDPALGPLNNPVELTIWFGPVAALLALLALLDRRSRGRGIVWAAFAVSIVLMMIGTIDWEWVLELPGLRYSPATRLRTLLPPAAAFLVAGGARSIATLIRRRGRRAPAFALAAVGAILAMQYARVGAQFYPYLPVAETRIEETRSIERLQVTDRPFRVAPTFYWMMPNSSQIFGVEDIRSQWSSEAAYREIILRIDPQAAGRGSVLLFNGLTMNVEDPLLRLLNVRYIVEPPSIDILRWRIEEKIERLAPPESFQVMGTGESAMVEIPISENLKVLELTARPSKQAAFGGNLLVEAIRPETGKPFAAIARNAAELAAEPKVFVPVTGAAAGERVLLKVTVIDGSFRVAHTDGEIYVRRSSSSLVLSESDPGARTFELVDTLPRYRATWEIVEVESRELLMDRGFDFEHRTAVEDADPLIVTGLSSVPARDRRVRFRLLRYEPAEQIVETESEVPFLFTTSEKLTPELRVYVDGEEVEPIEINGIFAGVPMEAGTHRVVLERRIGRGWWAASLIGLIGLSWSMVIPRSRRIR